MLLTWHIKLYSCLIQCDGKGVKLKRVEILSLNDGRDSNSMNKMEKPREGEAHLEKDDTLNLHRLSSLEKKVRNGDRKLEVIQKKGNN